MRSNRRRGDRGVLRTGSEDTLLAAIRHHQALRDREVWRREISGMKQKPKEKGRSRFPRDERDGFAAGIARIEFVRFYFKDTAVTPGNLPKRGK